MMSERLIRHVVGRALCGLGVLACLASPGFGVSSNQKISEQNSAHKMQNIIDKYKRAVVKVIVDGTGVDDKNKHREGTGFFIYSNKGVSYLVTANHVIGSNETEQTRNIDWKVENGRIARKITIDIFDEHGALLPNLADVLVAPTAIPGVDLALLMLKQDHYTTLTLAEESVDEIEMHNVVLLGFQNGRVEFTVPIPNGTGQLASPSRYVTSIPSHSGESGGPWIDLESGKVFAVASEVQNDPSGPSNEATPVTLIRPSLSAYFKLAGLELDELYENGLPPLKSKTTQKVGFAQSESDNPWRLAQSASMKAEAEKLGWQFVYTNAEGSAAKQVADVDSMITQGVDVIFLSPREEKPLIPAVMAAKKAGIPLFLIDRSVDPKSAKAGRDYVAFIGTDFVLEGKQAGEWLARRMDGNATILEIEGSIGSLPARDRKEGFDAVIAKHPDMKIVASESGNFSRDGGREIAETMLRAHPEANALYAQNDEMAIGAIAAIQAVGKKPGKDVVVVSIDGEKDGLQAIIDGTLGATVESSPRFGPAAFAAALAYSKGEKVPPIITNGGTIYDASNASRAIADTY